MVKGRIRPSLGARKNWICCYGNDHEILEKQRQARTAKTEQIRYNAECLVRGWLYIVPVSEAGHLTNLQTLAGTQ